MTSTSDTPVIQTPIGSNPNSRPGTPNLATPPPSVQTSGAQDDSSKLRLFLSLLKKFIGVPDIANVRFSLPTQLIEPIPNLEYWHYLDRPETFVSIGKSNDEVGRMLEVLRFWFTKDLKYVKGKPCKPYNSVLGEFFRCNWEINEEAPPIATPNKAPPQPPQDPLAPTNGKEPLRLSYITEQTSHHPPVSAYYIHCPERGLHAQGYDQIAAKFTGTAVRVTPGNFNRGIFITLSKRDNEEYRMTHPAASLSGILKGSLYISVTDTCFITCPKTRLKTILTYYEDSWIGRAQNKVKGIVFKYDPDNDKCNQIKDVPDKDVLVRIEGCWHEKIYYWSTSGSSKSDKSDKKNEDARQLLLDVAPLMPVPKICPPPEEQLPNESRRFWKDVTEAIQEKRFNDANKLKQDLEQRQRDKAVERKTQEWKPRFFTEVTETTGQPHLSQDGQLAMDGMQNKSFQLKESDVLGA